MQQTAYNAALHTTYLLHTFPSHRLKITHDSPLFILMHYFPHYRHFLHRKSIANTLLFNMVKKPTSSLKKKKKTQKPTETIQTERHIELKPGKTSKDILRDMIASNNDNLVSTNGQAYKPVSNLKLWTNARYKNLIYEYIYDTRRMMDNSNPNFYIQANLVPRLLPYVFPGRKWIVQRNESNTPGVIQLFYHTLYAPHSYQKDAVNLTRERDMLHSCVKPSIFWPNVR